MPFCPSIYVKKIMELLAFIFEQPSYVNIVKGTNFISVIKLIIQTISEAKVRLNKAYKGKIVINLYPISINIFFGCSKELSHCDGSFEYPQRMFQLRNKRKNDYKLLSGA